MHVGDDVRNTVAFLGYKDSTSPGGIRCFGTGVLVHYKGSGYLVTARHVVESIDGAPFLVRVNRRSGGSNLLRGEEVVWQYHSNENVDVAAIPFHATLNLGFDSPFIMESTILSDEIASVEEIGIGDFCYTVGLFRYMSGQERNEPVMFTGHVALWNGKNIPIWNKYRRQREVVDGHLVQSHGLQGASGSPVFVRGPFNLSDLTVPKTGRKFEVTMAVNTMHLMGIMQGAWFLPPDELLRAEIGAGVSDTVPIGLGIVTPASKIIELLEQKEFQEMRKKTPPPPELATMTSAPTVAALPASDENPKYREDFKG